jgi:hypothetical protein
MYNIAHAARSNNKKGQHTLAIQIAERLADTHRNISPPETFYVPLRAGDHTTSCSMGGSLYDRSNTTAEEAVKQFGVYWFGLSQSYRRSTLSGP